jgi:hypothetical protein
LLVPDAPEYARLGETTIVRPYARWGNWTMVAYYYIGRDMFDQAIAEFSAVYPDQNERDTEAVREFGFLSRCGQIALEPAGLGRANRTAPMYICPVDPSAAVMAASRCGHTSDSSRRAVTMVRPRHRSSMTS